MRLWWFNPSSSIACDVAKRDHFLFFLFITSCRNNPAQVHDDGEMPGPSSAEQEVKFWKETDTSSTSWLQKLPSFISLQSSPCPGDQGCKVEKDEDESEDETGRKLLLCFCSCVLPAAPIPGAGRVIPPLLSMGFGRIGVPWESPNQLRWELKLGWQLGFAVSVHAGARAPGSAPETTWEDFVPSFYHRLLLPYPISYPMMNPVSFL